MYVDMDKPEINVERDGDIYTDFRNEKCWFEVEYEVGISFKAVTN